MRWVASHRVGGKKQSAAPIGRALGSGRLGAKRRVSPACKSILPGCAVPPIRGICTRRVEAFGVLSHCPGEDGVKAYGPLVPWDVLPGDFESGARLLFFAIRSVTPPSFESAGFAAWMVRGVLP